jgi:anti-sigma regulatory factor (Ser/Thr protein kinase)
VSGTSPHGREAAGVSHEVVFYEGHVDLARAVLPFLREGIARREPVLVTMLPDRMDRIAHLLGDDATRVDFVDMSELGANPACIIPEWRRFVRDAAGSGGARGVGEPVWSGRREVEVVEAALHESLLNLAYDDGDTWRLLCPYDTEALSPAVLAEAARNHPVVHPAPGNPQVSAYAGPAQAWQRFVEPLPAVPGRALSVPFDGHDLGRMREHVAGWASAAGLDAERTGDVVLAVHEVVVSSVLHGDGGGRLHAWQQDDALVLEVRDQTLVPDPLVGRGLADDGHERGRGIWMANQLCDLVQVRSGQHGTQVRLHTWLAGPDQPGVVPAAD